MSATPDPDCVELGVCQCGKQCLECGWSKCVCSSKWSRDSWPHCKDYEEAHVELAQRFRHLDSIVDKCLTDLNLAHIKSVDQLEDWIWYVIDRHRSAELTWAQRTRCTKIRQ
jgi:hypothetical protein